MGLLKKRTKQESQPFETRSDLHRLYVYVTIVNKGVANPILKLLQRIGASAQYVMIGQGTAIQQVRHILGIEDTDKEVIFTIIRDDKLEKTRLEIEAFFASSDKNKGIGFAVPMSSIIGVTAYRFLSNTL